MKVCVSSTMILQVGYMYSRIFRERNILPVYTCIPLFINISVIFIVFPATMFMVNNYYQIISLFCFVVKRDKIA